MPARLRRSARRALGEKGNNMDSNFDKSFNGKVRFTEFGGTAVLFKNGTGAASVRGTCVSLKTATPWTVALTGIDQPDCVGVVLEPDIPDGGDLWVTISGVAPVLFGGSATVKNLARTPITADSGAAGIAIAEAFPTSPFATDKHFCEIGHIIESRTGAGLANVILHFN